MARDSLGHTLATVIDEMTTADDKTFTIRLREPFPLLLAGLAKVSSLPPFIMPERLAKTDPYQQVTETVGFDPLKFVTAEFQPGHKAVYVKNSDYVPRDEPPSWASGGKVVKVYRPEYSTAAAALGDGEVDLWEAPNLDLVPVLTANPDIRVGKTDPLGSTTMLRFNHLLPPFNNVKLRQAVLAVIDQSEFMSALAGDPANWNLCPSFFTCGTPMATKVGSEALTGKRDFDKEKKLIAEAGYKGEKIVVLDAVDTPTAHSHGLVVLELIKRLGLNVELASSDWGSLVIRRALKKTVEEGGWSIFGTGWTGVETLDPSSDLPLAANGGAAWFGWPGDDKLEALRTEWLKTSDSEARQEIAAKIQSRAFETLPYIPTGQWSPVTAYRKNIKGVIIAPALFMWNLEKT
jgi:peptide/nickel transport system substrate-binding protein